MPLPGGPADKIGNRYEQWWTVSQFVRIIDEEAESIRIEDPTTEMAEFVITTGDGHEFHQTKRSHLRGQWSLSELGSPKHQLLQTMFKQLSESTNIRFVFVSGSDAPELRELTERAVDAENLEEFESEFVSAKSQKEALEKLKRLWYDADTATAYKILQRIEVHTRDERGIEDLVRVSLSALFLTKPGNVCDALRSFAQDSIHRVVNREMLISYLEGKGFTLRRLSSPGDASILISETTDRYLRARRRLIQDTLIPRSSTQELLAKIDENETNGADCVLTGKAGGGKTGCVIECVEALQQSDDVAVLAFRLDRIDPVSSTKELGKSLGLEESPALVLATAAKAMSRDAVLVIDQLDAVSTTSGRRSDFFEVVEHLLDEVRGLRNSVKFHVVVVCRKFDWENDHRLRRPLGKDCIEVSVTDFSMDEVKEVLQTGGFKPELFETGQLELLGLPQNLSLFLDTNYNPGSRPTFFTQKDLFDRYWKEKHRVVNRRIDSPSDHWTDVIQVLCDKMTESQQLSVLDGTLDKFPPDYLDAMVSESVLSIDQNRYGFGHEAFFDYCFARGFVAKDESLTAFLKKSEQHLFRRAQVRQVLIYLRDADRERYCEELCALLTDENIRYHLKDLAVAVAVDMPNPEEAEWNVLAPWIESELEAIKNSTSNTDKFASLVWSRFFSSQSWFQIADKKGLVAEWLSSKKEALVDMGTNYVRFHQRHSGDRVADLLRPFIGKGGDWPQRFKGVMQSADLANSRRFFDLFLELIDDGTLDDDARDSTFWYNLHSLENERAEWIPEVFSHWLLRRLSIIQQTVDDRGNPNWRGLFGNSDYSSVYISKAVTQAPDKFVQHVLPVILEISDEAAYGKVPPKRDAVWGLFFYDSEYDSIDGVYREAVAVAMEKLAESKPDCIAKILANLQSRETYLANFLLLRAYAASARHFADEAVSELCNKTWRFKCGYSDSRYWIAIQLIKAVTPLCSDENRAKLEETILDYAPDYERSSDGYKERGYACFALLSGIPVELRSERAQARYAQLERKFGKADFAPRGSQGGLVVSPISESATPKMTDDEWLKAIKRYDSKREIFRGDPTKGGARELARSLQGRVQEEPERFAHLSLKFPADTNPVYMEHILMGLKETEASLELKLKVCRKAYAESRDRYGKEIADLLGSLRERLPDDAVQMLDWLATEHSDPEKELWDDGVIDGTPNYGRDIINRGINTTRGRAALAISGLISSDASYIDRFRTTIERLIDDNSLAVRSCVGFTLLPILNPDPKFALEQFSRLIESQGRIWDHLFIGILPKFFGRLFDTITPRDSLYDHLLVTPYVGRFISYAIRDHFGQLRHVVKRMLRSKVPETSQAGARLASLAVLYQHSKATGLVKEALRGNTSQRLGVAQVASANIGRKDCRAWAEQQLLLLFDDPDGKVRGEAGRCFQRLQEQPLESYANLIEKFCDSAAYQEGSVYLLPALEESSHRLPSITYIICKKFLDRFSDEARDVRTRRSLDITFVPKLVFRTYHQHQSDEWATKCLNLIDQMCLERSHEIGEGLKEYER